MMPGSMVAPLDLSALSPPARKALSADAPAPLRSMAAKGILPGAKPADLLTVVALLTLDAEHSIAAVALETLHKLPLPMLETALQSGLQASPCAVLAERFATDAAIVERLLRQPALPRESLELLAAQADEARGELIATNEERLLSNPTVIEKLYMNRLVRMSTSTRLIELAVRNGLKLALPAFEEAAAAILQELIPEASAESSPADELFREVDQLAQTTEIQPEDDTHDVDDEGKEQLKAKFKPLYAQLDQMTVTEKIRRATLGTSAERLLLVRSSNRLVSSAAAKSPLMRDSDAITISASRSVSEEVLRIIARNRDLTRSYQVKLNLVINPRTPFTFASGYIPLLRDNDLRMLAKSKNVPSAVNQAARRQIMRKQGKTKS